MNWIEDAAKEIAELWPTKGGRDSYWTPEQKKNIAERLAVIIQKHHDMIVERTTRDAVSLFEKK